MVMAIIFNHCYHHTTSYRSLSNSILHPNRYKSSLPRLKSTFTSSLTASLSTAFTWDDVLQVSESHASHLLGYFQKVNTCNRGSDMKHEFVPFIVEDKVVGYIHDSFAERLKKAGDAFVFNVDNDNVSNNRGPMFNVRHQRGLESLLYQHPDACVVVFTESVELNFFDSFVRDGTKALGEVVKFLGDEIPGIRNELYPVTSSFRSEVFFSLERAAAPFFGIKSCGVHMNGYVEKEGQKYLWVAKRSDSKPTYPGILDHLVAGGLECEEEAGIPRSISKQAIPVGAVSYMDINGYYYKRDVLFCYDLKLPRDFIPLNQDGEVGSFKLIPVPIVANIIRNTYYFKSNCNLVIIDFLVRHGYIRPEDAGYLELLQKLRSGDCS